MGRDGGRNKNEKVQLGFSACRTGARLDDKTAASGKEKRAGPALPKPTVAVALVRRRPPFLCLLLWA